MDEPAHIVNLDAVIGSIVASLIGLVGIVFLIQLVISGYSYISAGGNKEALVKASHSFTYAFIGLVLALAAWIIVSMVGTFLGVNVMNFSVCITPGCS